MQILLGLLVFSPLLVTFATPEVFETPKIYFLYLIALLLLTSWVLSVIRNNKIVLPQTPFNKVIVLILTATLLSTLFALDIETAVFGYYTRFSEGLLATLAFIVIFFSTFTLKKKQVIQLLVSLIVITTLIALYGILQRFGVDAHFWKQSAGERVFSTLGQPNWLAAFLSTIIPIEISFFLEETKLLIRIMLILTILIAILALIFTFSTTGFLGLAGALLIFALGKAKKPIRTGIVTLIIIMTMSYAVFTNNKIMARIEDTGRIRMIVWQGSLETFKDAPLSRKILGFGPGNFAYAFLPSRPSALNQTPEWDLLFNKPHNEFIDILINQGLFGLLAHLGFILVFARWFLRRSKQSPNDILILGLFSGWVSLLLTSFFGFFISITKLLFWLLPAFCVILDKDVMLRETVTNIPKKLKTFLTCLVLLVSVFGLFKLSQLFVADVDYAMANRLTKTGRQLESFVFYEQAIKLNKRISHYHRDYAISLSQFSLLEEVTFKREAESYKSKATLEIEKALEINPRNSLTLRSAIGVYSSLGSLDKKYYQRGLEIARQAITLIPTDSTLYYLETSLLIKLKDPEGARSAFQQATNLKPDNPQRAPIEQELNLMEKKISR